jgi:multimeric flavodoxin WrbA
LVEKIRLLGICASPRKTGNSRFLLEKALKGASEAAPDVVETELFSMAGKQIGPCISCFRCVEAGDCTTEDDFHELRDKWVAADAVIYSVPVYHMGIPAQLKCFIDRLGNSLFSFYGGSLSKNLKTVGVVVQGSHVFAGQEQVMVTLICHAVLMSCVPVAGDAWQSYLGAAGWTRDQSRKDSLRRLYDEGEADAEIAVTAADSLGKRVVQMARVIRSGGVTHREMLEKDGAYTAFLSRFASGE